MLGKISNTSDKSRIRSVSFSNEEEKVRKYQDKRNDAKKSDKNRAKIQGDLLDLKFSDIFNTSNQWRGKYDHKSLKSLNLNRNKITDIKIGGESYKYYVFSGSNHNLLELRMKIVDLEEINLSHNKLTEFLSESILECTPRLRKLILNDNSITVLPSASLKKLGQFKVIEELNLGSNNLIQIPGEIGLLSSLKSLKLSNNKLVALPREIVELKNFSDSTNIFNIHGNVLIEPPQLTAQQGGFDWICAYYQMKKPDENFSPVECYRHTIFLYHMDNAGKKGKVASTSANKAFQLRLLVVGHAGSGKTTLIKHLRDSSSGAGSTGIDTFTAARSASSEECRTPLRGTPRHAARNNHTNNNSSGSLRQFELKSPGRLGSPSFDLDGVDWASPDRINSRPNTPCTAGSGDGCITPLRTISSPFPIDTPTRSSEQQLQHIEAGITITPWFPKKTALDKFLIAKTAETKKQEKHSKSLFSFHPEDVKFSIWDCAGAVEQHSIQRMFFSEFSLQLVVFDLSCIETVLDVDVHVQYWIDMIQTHAPGANIVLAATHVDKLSVLEITERIALVQQRVNANETSRTEDLKQEIYTCREPERKQRLCRLQKTRPYIDAEIITLGHNNEANIAVLCLACRLVQLATPTKRTPHPCGSIGKELPNFVQKIKKAISEFRAQKQQYCTLVELQNCFLKQTDLHNNPEIAEHHSKLDGKMLRDTKTALAHLARIGEIVWFDFSDSSSSGSGYTIDTPVRSASVSHGDADSEPEHQFRPLTRSLTGDFESSTPRPPSTPSSSALAATNEVIFLDTSCLLRCIKAVFSRELLEDIRTVERFPLKYDDEAKREAEHLNQAKSSALRGIVKWAFIRNYLMRCSYEEKVVEVVRSVLEHYKMIIPIPAEPNRSGNVQRSQSSSALSQSLSQSTSSKGGAGETVLYPQAPVTPITHSRAYSVGPLPHSFSFTVAPPLALDRLLSTSSMQSKDEQYYLIPALVPKSEPFTSDSGLIILERKFVFNHFAPPDLLPVLYAAVYTFPQKSTVSNPTASTSICWESAFMQEHGCCRVHVEILPDPLVAAAAAGQVSSTTNLKLSSRLRIRGIGHVLNAQIILEHLDKYINAVSKVLENYSGLGNVRLSSTCPSCLLHQTDESKMGEFRYSELSLLQKNFCMMSEKIEKIALNFGSLPGKFQLELRRWNSKRHTCPFNRCQVKSDMLVHIPRNLKLALEAASQSEKEINFLLDEVVCSSAVPSDNIVNGVVKIMAVNTDQDEVAEIKRLLAETAVGTRNEPAAIRLGLSTGQYSSGVVVALPPDHPLRSGANRDGTDEVLILACEHVITKAERVGGRMVYTQVGPPAGKQTIFIIGDAKNWLFLAELIFQGSLSAGSETNFWDMCALKIVAPIEPMLQQRRQHLRHVHVLLPTVPMDGRRFYVQPEQLPSSVRADPGRSDADSATECIRLFHPSTMLCRPVMHSIAVSARSVAVDQVVRRLGFPKFPKMLELSVDWGRVEQNDPNGDILISLLSDEGASGGPVVDREGELIGLLSRSHEYIRFSCVQQLRNLFNLLRDL